MTAHSEQTEKLTDEMIEVIAKILWGRPASHYLLKECGHPTDWESQPRVVKLEKYNFARKIMKALAALSGTVTICTETRDGKHSESYYNRGRCIGGKRNSGCGAINPAFDREPDTVHSGTRKLLMHIAVSCAFAHHDDALSPSDSEFIRTAAIRIRGIADKYRKALEAK